MKNFYFFSNSDEDSIFERIQVDHEKVVEIHSIAETKTTSKEQSHLHYEAMEADLNCTFAG